MKLCQTFVPVNKQSHLLKKFDCGKAEMNTFLSRFAVKHAKLGLSRTFVLPVDDDTDKRIVSAYYTLAMSTVTPKKLPVKQSLPNYSIATVLLARLAVDINFQGRRLGEKSLIAALRHAVKLCDSGLPALGLILDVLDEDALAFYQRFDCFHALTDDPMRLFVSMNTLREI
ncbi:MAG: GNAT family N-acetyltransferase [Pseudoalteromonas tetraodonis]|nr:GNAT family N-acetyltransferase [Pseudoalteromonas tetraodonis]